MKNHTPRHHFAHSSPLPFLQSPPSTLRATMHPLLCNPMVLFSKRAAANSQTLTGLDQPEWVYQSFPVKMFLCLLLKK